MWIKKSDYNFGLRESDVTSETVYHNRRRFIKAGTALGLLSYFPALAYPYRDLLQQKITTKQSSPYSTDEERNTFEQITTYNNFYELGTDKSDPIENAGQLITDPWSIEIDGHCRKPGKYTLEDILQAHDLQERIYRLRCVEAWSMVVPWIGFPLAELIKRFEPTEDAKYVAFETLYDRKDPLPGQKRAVLKWPYREGLRMDEAMNPLTLLAVGLYGKVLPNQNGAPIRLVVPWKYGFKSIKSIVKIKFTKHEPKTSWNMSAPQEYGFYSNVNPNVNHPRWSQKRERRIGEFLKRPTLMFNGYEQYVAHLYKGMDLKRNF